MRQPRSEVAPVSEIALYTFKSMLKILKRCGRLDNWKAGYMEKGIDKKNVFMNKKLNMLMKAKNTLP